LVISQLLGADYWLTDNQQVPYRCIYNQNPAVVNWLCQPTSQVDFRI